MSNFLVLDSDIYHNMIEDNKRLDKQFRSGAIPPTPVIPSRVLMKLNVVAIVSDDCVELLKNRCTNDFIMSLEDFETFKQEYLK